MFLKISDCEVFFVVFEGNFKRKFFFPIYSEEIPVFLRKYGGGYLLMLIFWLLFCLKTQYSYELKSINIIEERCIESQATSLLPNLFLSIAIKVPQV